MHVRPAGKKSESVVIDYREVAPKAATKNLFVEQGKKAHLTVGVPGSVAGLAMAHEKYGKLKWKQLVLPAVKLAEEGFAIDSPLASSLNSVQARGKEFPELKRVFGKEGGKWKAGDKLVQKDLAKTLGRIAEKGAEGFYKGETAELLVKEMKAGKGLITAERKCANPSTAPIAVTTSTLLRRPPPAASVWCRCSTSWSITT
jgi:gamma-glutamyltranspeptidase/glutathione hydrolase